MRLLSFVGPVTLVLFVPACSLGALTTPNASSWSPPPTLAEARASVHTTIHEEADRRRPPRPPRGDLELVRYAAPLGRNFAYVTPVRGGSRRPAVLWIRGGFDGGIDENAWIKGPRENEESARAIRDAGIAEMYASLRGWNGNPGKPECLLGEVDDILAAAVFLASRPDVDPARVYVAGHSTGGTLALLAAESSSMFRAAVAFGPIADVRGYRACLPKDAPPEEWFPRATWPYLRQLTTPTWIVEGAEHGNAKSIGFLLTKAGDAPVHVAIVDGRDHFSVLAPGVEQLVASILDDTGSAPAFDMSAQAILVRN